MIIASWTQSHVYLLMPVSHSVLNVKALVGTFNQEKALVGAFSVIVQTDCATDGSFYSTIQIASSVAVPPRVSTSNEEFQRRADW